jgi:ABC-type multidrug transport system fused ATPase/permease subunit
MLNKLKLLLSKRDKQFLILLLLFSLFISVIETIGVSIIMPYVAVASNFTLIHTNKYYLWIYNYFGFHNDINFVIIFGFLLIFFYLFRSVVNLFYFYLLARFSKGRYYVIAYKLFENYLSMPYRGFIDRNSSNLTKTIISEAQNVTELISALLFMVSEIFIIILIYTLFIYINWKITLALSVILLLNALLLTQTVSKKIKKLGQKRELFQKRFFEVINTTMGNFKMIKLHGEEKDILKEFSQSTDSFAKTYIANESLSNFPRLFLEAIGFSIVASIIIYLVYINQSDISHSFGLISMFVLGLYRLLPSVNRILVSYNKILFYRKSLDIVHNDLIYEIEDLGTENISFNKEIRLENLSFSYIDSNNILKNINISIKKGKKIAFTGESGSGKSTLVDIIIGLYKPSAGNIYIDNTLLTEKNVRSWRKRIGYIPQSIYLFDGTVAQNVTMGKDINSDKVIEVLKKANIWDFLDAHHQGIETNVGEGGVKLSGGQKQRIAIARALYFDPEILVLDEATSALDEETEAKIMQEIYKVSEDKTLIIIAHRLSTIDGCDVVYKLDNGQLMGKY